jgi:D-psicose/D-tagatose/L-ribulose 3-epimerase
MADVGLIDKVKQLGFDLLEVPIWTKDQFDVSAVTEALKRAELEPVVMAAMTPTQDPVHPDPAVRRAGREYLRYCVDVAVQMGANLIAGPISSAPGRYWISAGEQRRRELDLCEAAMREAAEYAADNGVELAIEILNRYETSFINTMEDACALVDAVDHPAVGLLFDTFHMGIEEKYIPAAIEFAGERVKHFHACENDRGTAGTGHVPWPEVASALKAIDYKRAVVIESFMSYVDEFSKVAFVWRPFAPDMDGLASEGLAFLKAVMA